MAKPKQVKIGPHTYVIKYSKQAWKDEKIYKTDMVGVCLIAQSTILIKEWLLSTTQIRDTLLHEILHACYAMCMLDNQPFSIPDNMHDVEEMMILFLSPQLLQVIIDNPDLVEWLQNV